MSRKGGWGFGRHGPRRQPLFRAPRGMGWLSNPKKWAANQKYKMTHPRVTSGSSRRSQGSGEGAVLAVVGLVVACAYLGAALISGLRWLTSSFTDTSASSLTPDRVVEPEVPTAASLVQARIRAEERDRSIAYTVWAMILWTMGVAASVAAVYYAATVAHRIGLLDSLVVVFALFWIAVSSGLSWWGFRRGAGTRPP